MSDFLFLSLPDVIFDNVFSYLHHYADLLNCVKTCKTLRRALLKARVSVSFQDLNMAGPAQWMQVSQFLLKSLPYTVSLKFSCCNIDDTALETYFKSRIQTRFESLLLFNCRRIRYFPCGRTSGSALAMPPSPEDCLISPQLKCFGFSRTTFSGRDLPLCISRAHSQSLQALMTDWVDDVDEPNAPRALNALLGPSVNRTKADGDTPQSAEDADTSFELASSLSGPTKSPLFQPFTQLQALAVVNSQLLELKCLSALPNLQFLFLGGSSVRSSAISDIMACPSLKAVEVTFHDAEFKRELRQRLRDRIMADYPNKPEYLGRHHLRSPVNSPRSSKPPATLVRPSMPTSVNGQVLQGAEQPVEAEGHQIVRMGMADGPLAVGELKSNDEDPLTDAPNRDISLMSLQYEVLMLCGHQAHADTHLQKMQSYEKTTQLVDVIPLQGSKPQAAEESVPSLSTCDAVRTKGTSTCLSPSSAVKLTPLPGIFEIWDFCDLETVYESSVFSSLYASKPSKSSHHHHHHVEEKEEPVHIESIRQALSFAVNCIDRWSRTPLHYAVLNSDPRAVRTLLSLGSELEMRDKKGCSPFMRAAEFGKAEVLAALLNAGANVTTKNHNLESPLFVASLKGKLEAVSAILKHVPNPAAVFNNPSTYQDGWTPVSAACISGNLPILKMLCQYGLDLDYPNKFGASPLHIAVRRGFLEGVQTLVQAGANVFAKDGYGVSVIDTLPRSNEDAIRVVLQSRGAAVRARGPRPSGAGSAASSASAARSSGSSWRSHAPRGDSNTGPHPPSTAAGPRGSSHGRGGGRRHRHRGRPQHDHETAAGPVAEHKAPFGPGPRQHRSGGGGRPQAEGGANRNRARRPRRRGGNSHQTQNTSSGPSDLQN